MPWGPQRSQGGFQEERTWKMHLEALASFVMQGLISLWWEAFPSLKSSPGKLGINECVSDSQWYYCLDNKVLSHWHPGASDFPAHILPPLGIFPGLLHPKWFPLFSYATSTKSPNHIKEHSCRRGAPGFCPSLAPSPCKTLGKCQPLSGPQFPYL